MKALLVTEKNIVSLFQTIHYIIYTSYMNLNNIERYVTCIAKILFSNKIIKIKLFTTH